MKKHKQNTHRLTNDNSLKTKIEWIILIFLILVIPFGVWSSLFAYGYNYLRCEDRPTEVFGKYYRIPYDRGYGIHPGSDYSNCSYGTPEGKIRDPSSIAGTKIQKPEYDVYIPDGYTIVGSITNPEALGQETSFRIKTESGIVFRVREMKKDSDFSYVSLCTKPATDNWSGTIIGKDSRGKDICRTNLSKYIEDYIVGINIGRTDIMLRTTLDKPEELLNTTATDIFNSMRLY